MAHVMKPGCPLRVGSALGRASGHSCALLIRCNVFELISNFAFLIISFFFSLIGFSSERDDT